MRSIHLTFNYHKKFVESKKNLKNCKKAPSYFKKNNKADRNSQFLTEDNEPMRTEPLYQSSDEDNTSQCPTSDTYLTDKHGDEYDTMNIFTVHPN